MVTNFPIITLTDVYDYVPHEYCVWSFLGTIAIDVAIDLPESKTICAVYENADGSPKSLNACIYLMTLQEAHTLKEQRDALETLDE